MVVTHPSRLPAAKRVTHVHRQQPAPLTTGSSNAFRAGAAQLNYHQLGNPADEKVPFIEPSECLHVGCVAFDADKILNLIALRVYSVLCTTCVLFRFHSYAFAQPVQVRNLTTCVGSELQITICLL